MEPKEILIKSIQQVEKWVEGHGYKSYEPFDGLLSFLRPLTFGNLFAERVLQQLVRQSPINIRPLLGIKPQESTKGRGYMAWGFLIMFKLTGNVHYKEKAVNCLEWLIENKAPGYLNYSWGNAFDYSSRGGKYSKSDPITVWTSLIGQAFLDAYEELKEERYLEIAKSICDWIVDLPREKTTSGACLSYLPFKQSSIHNANMLGAAMLGRTAKHTHDHTLLKVAKEAMEYSCSRQLREGAWYYGESSNTRWVDNFHTGYNLDSLKCYIENTDDQTYTENLRRGVAYFKKTFFESDGKPRYYSNRVYPVDIQCASQAVDTLANVSEYDPSSLELGLKVARWTIDHMQDRKGYFYYRVLPWIKIKTPMLHWGQATMYKALTLLLSKMDGKKLDDSIR